MKNEIALRPSYWASVSGGKDSLYMLNLILHNLDKYPLDGVVHFELEIDFPFIHDVIDYMESECKRFGIEFVRIKPQKSWKELYNSTYKKSGRQWGFPTRAARWCNEHYKLNAKKQLDKWMHDLGCYTVFYIGYCVDEKSRYEKRTSLAQTEIYPLVEFNIEEDTILEWAKNQPIYNDYYKYNRRCGCMYCPMASMETQAYLLKYYPEHYDEVMRLAKETELMREQELGRAFSVWSSNAKYNTDYRDKLIREKYLPLLFERECQLKIEI